MSVLGFYGESRQRLIAARASKIFSHREFDVAVIDLKQTEEKLWHNIHPKHRSEVNKAHRYNLRFTQSSDIEYFLKLLHETYRRQNLHTPDLSYIRKEFEVKDLGDLSKITGLAVIRTEEGIYLSHKVYGLMLVRIHILTNKWGCYMEDLLPFVIV